LPTFEIINVSINIQRALVISKKKERERERETRELGGLENKRRFKGKTEQRGGREGEAWRGVATEASCHRRSTSVARLPAGDMQTHTNKRVCARAHCPLQHPRVVRRHLPKCRHPSLCLWQAHHAHAHCAAAVVTH